MTKDREYQMLAWRIFADFSASIAVPAVLGALLGKWLDTRYGTKPYLLIACLAAALLLTAINIVHKAKYYNKEYSRLNENNNL